MNDSSKDPISGQFEILRQIALAGAAGENLEPSVRKALADTNSLLGLAASRLILWDDSGVVKFSVSHAFREDALRALDELEGQLFSDLRRDRRLRNAYVSFAGDPAISAMTIPLGRGERVFGSILGAAIGDRRLMREDVFFEALAASLSLATFAELAGPLTTPATDDIKQARLKAALEMAVTVNHRINNPLTAALGNVQLLLLKRETLDPDLRRKLETIEKAALQIRDVTERLLKITDAKSVPYADGETMIDLGDDTPSGH